MTLQIDRSTVEHLIELHDALWRAESQLMGGRTWSTSADLDTILFHPRSERDAFVSYLASLPHEQLVELQALGWYGRDSVRPTGVEKNFTRCLERSRQRDDDLVRYLAGMGSLSRSLRRALDRLDAEQFDPFAVPVA